MARRKPPTVHGLAIVDKPAGITSHDVVGLMRRRLGEKRIGHAGTLDPDATGVLLIGVGSATRLLQYLQGADKVYTAEVVLGTATATLDSSGETTATFDMSGVTLEQVRATIAAHLTGPIMQIPPMVSALKVDGRRLHELAREGIEIERAPRPVTIHRFTAEATPDPMVFTIEVECSSGTYIRSLADDLGRLLGGGAHLRELRRRSVGAFLEAEAASPETCELLPVGDALRGYPRVTVTEQQAADVMFGRPLPRELFDGPAPWAVFDAQGAVLAMYEPFRGSLTKPAVVLAQESPR